MWGGAGTACGGRGRPGGLGGVVSGGVQHGRMVRKTNGRTGGGSGGGAARGGGGGGGVKPARRPEVRLPALEAYDGAGLAPDGDYDGLEFRDSDLSGQDGAGARFMDCALRGCALDDASLRHARFLDSVLGGVRGVGTDLAEATLRDVELTDARLGGTQLHGAVLERVLIRGGKIDYLNLRTARLRDVVFEGCVLIEPDFGGARLERVEFVDCALKGVEFTGATLTDVDLRGAAALEIAGGAERLAGAVISTGQLLDLAPVLAARLGIRVEG
ncbi:pentapeptide repeat-containing protein [Streptomyces sp. SID8499]|nr:pentapeptide repeat-containing protein [Streptomyces sp. SID8499]